MVSIIDSFHLGKQISFPHTIDGIVYGYEGFALAKIVQNLGDKEPIVYVARDGSKLADLAKIVQFVAPNLAIYQFPSWDCLPYDRVSPSVAILSQRLATLSNLLSIKKSFHPTLVLTTANAIIQKVLPSTALESQFFSIKVGKKLLREELIAYLEANNFQRVAVVEEKGDYAIRGGIFDIFSPNEEVPFRLDFFGDEVETIRSFDIESQKTIARQESFSLLPMSEALLTPESIRHFRRSYVEEFGAVTSKDALYESISENRRFSGMEHWLPLFYEKLESLFDYASGPIIFDYLAKEAFNERKALIDDYYKARQSQGSSAAEYGIYKALSPEKLYLNEEFLENLNQSERVFYLSPFKEEKAQPKTITHASIRKGKDFLLARQQEGISLFSEVVNYIKDVQKAKRTVLLLGWSEGSLNRLVHVLEEYDLFGMKKIDHIDQLKNLSPGSLAMAILPIEAGFETDDIVVITEQDILGDRLVTQQKKRKTHSKTITSQTALEIDDLVVHIDHGIGRFAGLKTINVLGAYHDCLELHYAGEDKLYLPVENIELLSRYSGPQEQAILDKIGGVAWQARKAKLKKRLLELAEHFITIAAKRALKSAPVIQPPQGAYDEFVARFPYEETPDQLQAIDAVIADLAAGKPMDRLICGDVGFGKTEVALRAAFICAFNGFQTAVIVPTTLLSRQHTQTFLKRFQGLPVRIAQLSRFISAKDRKLIENDLAEGKIDIVIGTHALLRQSLKFQNLGLVVIDEEQHFGVKHKERLKELKSSIHVLTLSATPIPRTLQLALTGVRELSLIASAPVDRLAVRTFVSPFDPLTIRETLLREYYRGGQSFYVCPRISDVEFIKTFLTETVPELKIGVAHGQLASKELDEVMNAFYDKHYHVLLATTIIESGLDIPSANTMIIHRADMFGLAALYQLRGRIGRSKQRGYALLTIPEGKTITKIAEKRLKILQSLDSLGMGFQLASHDMDLRGAGNLLGQEQSGHIKEVGFALYQQMLEEAVAQMQGKLEIDEAQWSPQINLGISVLLSENYVADLDLRLALYRRLAAFEYLEDIESFAAELIDRFGPLPEEAQFLLQVIAIKLLCKEANIEKIDAGEKGIVIYFRQQQFANPMGLVNFIGAQGSLAKLRPDQSVFFARDWGAPQKRLNGVARLVKELAKLAQQASH